MTVIRSRKESQRGPTDARRHRQKQRSFIKGHLPEIIADESIITKKHGKMVRIPIKTLNIPHFRAAKREEIGGAGIGQGAGKKGDIIGKRPIGKDPGQPGQEPGEDYLETEAPIEEIIEMMLEDLGLPNLQEKSVKELEVEFGFKFRGITNVGPYSLLRPKETVKEGLKHFFEFMSILEKKSGLEPIICFRALKQEKGSLKRALELLKNPSLISFEADEIKPFPIFISEEDYRYLKIEKDIRLLSRAVVIAMMDVSGSMSDMKKYLARSTLFWLVEFLRKIYEKVEIRFIIHHAEAKVVDEDSFFKTRESGGTRCYTAYELAGSLIDNYYPTVSWNVYVWHFSDGDDFNSDLTVAEMEKLFKRGINMLGYGEIRIDSFGNAIVSKDDSKLLNAIRNFFEIEESSEKDMKVISGLKQPLLGVVIFSKNDILPALKQFLKKDRRWGNEAK